MVRLIALLVCLLPASAQTASLRGTVTDPSGAAVPGATVEVGGRRTKTDSVGQYRFPSIAAGEYRVRVSAKVGVP